MRMRLLQINVTANSGSHGKIAEEIGSLAIQRGWQSVIAYGRWANPSSSELLRIGSSFDINEHGIESRILDNHGRASRRATKEFIKKIEAIKPDIIHLHNIHGYYLNYRILFDYLKTTGSPVVWTLHDCWPFTGHCAHFEYDGCLKWKKECFDCQFKYVYPASFFLECSRRNFRLKKECFTTLRSLTLVPVSDWLKDYLKDSFLREQNIVVIHNGVDINKFAPIVIERDDDVVELLGVASNWRMRKGLPDFIQLRERLPMNCHITLIGLSKKEIRQLPPGITGIERTNSVEELVYYYNRADVLVNPTYEDNFPTINIEALACGTPVITYRTGGSPEAVSLDTGWVVEQGDVDGIAMIIKDFNDKDNDVRFQQRMACRERAVNEFDKDKQYLEYFKLYEKILENR